MDMSTVVVIKSEMEEEVITSPVTMEVAEPKTQVDWPTNITDIKNEQETEEEVITSPMTMNVAEPKAQVDWPTNITDIKNEQETEEEVITSPVTMKVAEPKAQVDWSTDVTDIKSEIELTKERITSPVLMKVVKRKIKMDVKPTPNIKDTQIKPKKRVTFRTRPILMRAAKVKNTISQRRTFTPSAIKKENIKHILKSDGKHKHTGSNFLIRRKSWGMIAQHGSPPKDVPNEDWGDNVHKLYNNKIIQFRWDKFPNNDGKK